MNYLNLYNALISKRISDPPKNCYVENHHIIPKSLGGTDDKNNLVKLTAREHYVAHLLLTKIHPNNSKVHYALWMMNCSNSKHNRYKMSSLMYERARKNAAHFASENMKLNQSGRGNSQWNKRWICNVKLKINSKIFSNEKIPVGWIAGRNKWVVPTKNNKTKKRHEYYSAYYNDLFKIFANGNWDSLNHFSKSDNCNCSTANLTLRWKKYIPGFAIAVKHGNVFNSNSAKMIL